MICKHGTDLNDSGCINCENETEENLQRDTVMIRAALTIQALQMRNEIFAGGGMDKEMFDLTYLDGLGEYEREIVEKECIEI